MSTEEKKFQKLLTVLKEVVTKIYNNELIGMCVVDTFEKEGYENIEMTVEDLEEPDNSNILSVTTKNINNNKNINNKWNSNDTQIFYKLLLKIFKKNIIDINILYKEFKQQIITTPSTLINCTNNQLII